jgi:hypothetical protein
VNWKGPVEVVFLSPPPLPALSVVTALDEPRYSVTITTRLLLCDAPQAVPAATVTQMLSLCMAVGTIGRITGPLWGGNVTYAHAEVHLGMLGMSLIGAGECVPPWRAC